MDSVPVWLMYMQAGAYAAVMFAVLGVPQVLSGYFDNRSRRREHLESESGAERRHREALEERREERRQEEERRRQEFELQRQDSERRHQEMMALIINMSNGSSGRGEPAQSETVRAMQETIDALESENARLRGENGGDGVGE